ncbi:Anoctamin-7-like [Oopsacas minuta]|uniref:Anoctamin n=1 Tax=Oopsacas minuta TaxID=111878 RepID=A0AAV7K869_9METZ|nr:Anoctamin-7-like [Oopsacas minuta]
MTEHKLGFDNILGDLSVSNEDKLTYPMLEPEKEIARAPPEITIDTDHENTPLLSGAREYARESKVSLGLGEVHPHTQFFEDGHRRIDYILVYQDHVAKRDEKHSDDFENRAKKRDFFHKELEKIGLKLETAQQDSNEDESTGQGLKTIGNWTNKSIDRLRTRTTSQQAGGEEIPSTPTKKSNPFHFVKLHAPWHVLCTFAEELHLYAPIKDTESGDNKKINRTLWDRLGCRKIFRFTVPEIPDRLEIPEAPTQIFIKSKLTKYLNHDDIDNFFSPAQRALIVNYILNKTPYHIENEEVRLGINRLLRNKTYIDAFPLHEGNFKLTREERENNQAMSERQFLYHNWGSPTVNAFFKTQPLDQIRHYFGEKIAFYFAWLGFYTKWLHFATIIGLAVFIVSLYTIGVNPIAEEVCNVTNWNERKLFYMCPRCAQACDFTSLASSCISYRFSLMFDYWGTVVFAIAMSLWAVFFLEFWKRQQFYLQYEWDVLEYEVVEETVRPEFETKMRRVWEKAKDNQRKDKIRYENPITKTIEFFQEDYKIKAKFAATLTALGTLVAVVVAIVVGVIFYRAAVSPLIAAATSRASSENLTALSQFLSIFGGLLVSTSGALIQLIFIFIMNKVYEKIAVFLTAWELHRTQSEHEDSFTVKMYLFQFVNFYSSLFYIAFFKGRILVHFPGRDYGEWRGLEQCAAYGCLLELTIQLITIFILKQTLNNFVELGIPLIKIVIKYIKLYLSKRSTVPGEDKDQEGIRKKLAATTPWGRDYQLAPERDHGLFWEYLELVIQFGFVTIFAAAFPLAPFFALFNNYFEIRIDASKFCILTRRPLALKSQDIGPWYSILDIISKIAVVTNAFLIPFTGGFIDRILYQGETSMGVNGLNGFLNVTLNRIPIHNFILTEDFPEFSSRSINVILNDESTPLYKPYFDQTSYYCTNGCDRFVEVNATISTKNSLTTCCEYLRNQTTIPANAGQNSGFRNGSCLNDGVQHCCVNSADNNTNAMVARRYLNTTGLLQNSTSCCNALDRQNMFSQGDRFSLASGIYYKIDTNGRLDEDSPRNGLATEPTKLMAGSPNFIPGEYYDGCNVNIINRQIECRYRPTYQLNPYADQTEQIIYYRTMMVRLLFTVVFEHIIFATVVLVAFLVPDIPAEIKDQLYREKYLAKYAEYEDERKKRKIQEQEEELNFQASP